MKDMKDELRDIYRDFYESESDYMGRKKESILRLSGWTRAESRPDQME